MFDLDYLYFLTIAPYSRTRNKLRINQIIPTRDSLAPNTSLSMHPSVQQR